MKMHCWKMIVLGWVVMLLSGSVAAATAPRMVAKPMDKEQIVVYAYDKES